MLRVMYKIYTSGSNQSQMYSTLLLCAHFAQNPKRWDFTRQDIQALWMIHRGCQNKAINLAKFYSPPLYWLKLILSMRINSCQLKFVNWYFPLYIFTLKYANLCYALKCCVFQLISSFKSKSNGKSTSN